MALAGRGYIAVLIEYRLGEGEPFGIDQAVEPSQEDVVSKAISDAQSAVRWARTDASDLRIDPGRVAIGGTSAGAMTAAGAALSSPTADRPCTLVSISGDIETAWVGTEPVSALFVHGDADQVVPYESSVSAVQLITENGGDAQLVTVAGAGHEITGVPPPSIVTDTASWLREHAAAHCG
jgi:dipeptidyl aminopeptidase/acylaminoacyl peptidase